jgi:hypothetical protein
LPQNADERQKIFEAAISGSDNVISMPRYFKPWEGELPALRSQLKKIDNVAFLPKVRKRSLKIK